MLVWKQSCGVFFSCCYGSNWESDWICNKAETIFIELTQNGQFLCCSFLHWATDTVKPFKNTRYDKFSKISLVATDGVFLWSYCRETGVARKKPTHPTSWPHTISHVAAGDRTSEPTWQLKSGILLLQSHRISLRGLDQRLGWRWWTGLNCHHSRSKHLEYVHSNFWSRSSWNATCPCQ